MIFCNVYELSPDSCVIRKAIAQESLKIESITTLYGITKNTKALTDYSPDWRDTPETSLKFQSYKVPESQKKCPYIIHRY